MQQRQPTQRLMMLPLSPSSPTPFSSSSSSLQLYFVLILLVLLAQLNGIAMPLISFYYCQREFKCLNIYLSKLDFLKQLNLICVHSVYVSNGVDGHCVQHFWTFFIAHVHGKCAPAHLKKKNNKPISQTDSHLQRTDLTSDRNAFHDTWTKLMWLMRRAYVRVWLLQVLFKFFMGIYALHKRLKR